MSNTVTTEQQLEYLRDRLRDLQARSEEIEGLRNLVLQDILEIRRAMTLAEKIVK